MIRYSYVIPGASVREEIRGETTAHSEQHMRALLCVVYGHEAAQSAVLKAEEIAQREEPAR